MTKTTLAALLFATACATDPTEEPMDESMDPTGEEEQQPEEMQPETPTTPTPTPLASGAVDTAYGKNGVQYVSLGQGLARAMTLQGDKLLLCVNQQSEWGLSGRLMRLNLDGTLDATFGIDGVSYLQNISGAMKTACLDVVAPAPNLISVEYIDLATNTTRRVHLTAAGVIRGDSPAPIVGGLAASSGTSAGASVYGMVQSGKQVVSTDAPNGGSNHYTQNVLAGKTQRAFFHSNAAYAVGAYDSANLGIKRWDVLADAGQWLVPTGTYVSKGSDAVEDTMHDAVLMPDGSVFAVGGVDSDSTVMAARFTLGASPSVQVESHAHGGPSTGYAIVLDSANRPIVVGTAQTNGKTAFGWQRYEATGAKLDATYRNGGLASLEAPAGQGELVDAVRVGDRIYALANTAVETLNPYIALVRIAE